MKSGEAIRKKMEELGEWLEGEEWKEISKDLPRLIVDAAKTKDNSCDIEIMQSAVRFCRGRVFSQIASDDAWWTELFSLIKEKASLKKIDEEGVYWLEVLMEVRTTENERFEILDSMRPGSLGKPFYSTMEKWADKMPTIYVMEWYKSFIGKKPDTCHREKIYNRLAFFYLRTRWRINHLEMSRNYFKTLERYGHTIKNPYGGLYGQIDHTDMIDKILTGRYQEDETLNEIRYLNESIELFKNKQVPLKPPVYNIWEEESDDDDYEELKELLTYILFPGGHHMRKNHLEPFYEFLVKLYDVIEFHIKKGDEDSLNTAAMLLLLMYNVDNWLLKAIEIKAEGKGERYYELVGEWIKKIKTVGEKTLSVIQSSLYGVLIKHLLEGDKEDSEQAYNLLDEQVHTVDTPAVFNGILCHLGFYGETYFTDNTLALLNRYYETGQKEKANILIQNIRDTLERIGNNVWDHEEYFSRLLTKYIYLLKNNGNEEEVDRLIRITDDSEGTINCDEILLAFFERDYKRALDICKKRKDKALNSEDVDYKEKKYGITRINESGESYSTEWTEQEFEIADLDRIMLLANYMLNGELPIEISPRLLDDTGSVNGFNANISLSDGKLMLNTFFQKENWTLFYSLPNDMAKLFLVDCKSKDYQDLDKAQYEILPVYTPNPAVGMGEHNEYLERSIKSREQKKA